MLQAFDSKKQPSHRSRGQRLALGVTLMLFGLGLFALRSAKVVGTHPRQILHATPWSLEQVAAYKGPMTGPVRVDGAISATDYTVMPDTGEAVIRGMITVTLRARKSEAVKAGVAIPLYIWDEAADGLRLYEGSTWLPLDASPLDLPLFDDITARADLELVDDRPVAVKFGDLRFPIAKKWQGDVLSVDVRRQWLPGRLQVAVLAAIDGTGPRTRLVPLHDGTLEVVERTPRNLPPQRPLLGTLALVFGLGSLVLGAWYVRKALWNGFRFY